MPVCWNETDKLRHTKILIGKSSVQSANDDDEDDCSLKSLFKYDSFGEREKTATRTIHNSGKMLHCEISATNKSCFEQIQRTLLNHNKNDLGLKNIQLSIGFYESNGAYLKNTSGYFVKQGLPKNVPTENLNLQAYFGTVTLVLRELSNIMHFSPILTMPEDGIFFGYKVKFTDLLLKIKKISI